MALLGICGDLACCSTVIDWIECIFEVIFFREGRLKVSSFAGKASEAVHSYNYHEEDTIFKGPFVWKCFLLVSALKFRLYRQNTKRVPSMSMCAK